MRQALQLVPLDGLGLLGEYHTLMGSRPSPLEMCRYVRTNDRMCRWLLNSTREILEDAGREIPDGMFQRGASPSEKLDQIISRPEINGGRVVANTTRRFLKVASATQLRPYQLECTEALRETVQVEGSSLLVLPTGAGKTRTTMEAIRQCIDASALPMHVLWIVHVKELCEQAEHAFETVWTNERETPHHPNLWLNTVFDSGMTPTRELYADGHPSFTIATPDSIDSWGGDPPCEFALIVVDEAHHGIQEQHDRVFTLPHNHRLGLTATPELAADRGLFARTYANLIYPVNYLEGGNWQQQQQKMTEDGYLSSYEVHERSMSDEAADHIRLDEYNIEGSWHNQPAATAVGSRLAQDMLDGAVNKLVIFCERVDQCRTLASVLRDADVPTETIYGTLMRDERRSRIAGFQVGTAQVLVSVNVLREGVDLPSVDGILLLRKRLENDDPMFTQMIGRGLRGPKTEGGTEHCTIWHVVK